MEKEITLSVPIACLSSIATVVTRKIGIPEFYKRIGMNDDTFNEFPLALKKTYLWHMNKEDIPISDELFFSIVREARVPSLIASAIIKRGMTKQIKNMTGDRWTTIVKSDVRALFLQLTMEDVQRLIRLKYSWSGEKVYAILATYIKMDFVPMMLKIEAAAKFVEKRLKGAI
jgi:hypothetical protein